MYVERGHSTTPEGVPMRPLRSEGLADVAVRQLLAWSHRLLKQGTGGALKI